MNDKNHKTPLPFVFIDESGVLHNDPHQPFFAVGALVIENTSELVQNLATLRAQAVSSYGNRAQAFEFKFKSITLQNRLFYERLIDLASMSKIQANVIVVDKLSNENSYLNRFKYAWDAYVEIAKLVVERSIHSDSECVVIADFVQKPRISHAFLEPELKTLPRVRNATMLESHASLMIQLIDVLTGCVVFQHRIKKFPEGRRNSEKLRISRYLCEKLGVMTLVENFEVQKPIPFSVWKYQP